MRSMKHKPAFCYLFFIIKPLKHMDFEDGFEHTAQKKGPEGP